MAQPSAYTIAVNDDLFALSAVLTRHDAQPEMRV